MRALQIGVIAEDRSDVDVIRCLIGKLTSRQFSTPYFVGKGCGPLQRKVPAWCKALESKGCGAITLIHDLDRNDPAQLRKKLETILTRATTRINAVVIPTKELEAWLLADMDALRATFNLVKTPKVIHHPETIASPKEHLGEIIRKNSKEKRRRYVNSVHNLTIAKHVSEKKILAKCPSFRVFGNFVKDVMHRG